MNQSNSLIEISVVHKDGSITFEPMTKVLLYELRCFGQILDGDLRKYLQMINQFDYNEYHAMLNIMQNTN